MIKQQVVHFLFLHSVTIFSKSPEITGPTPFSWRIWSSVILSNCSIVSIPALFKTFLVWQQVIQFSILSMLHSIFSLNNSVFKNNTDYTIKRSSSTILNAVKIYQPPRPVTVQGQCQLDRAG